MYERERVNWTYQSRMKWVITKVVLTHQCLFTWDKLEKTRRNELVNKVATSKRRWWRRPSSLVFVQLVSNLPTHCNDYYENNGSLACSLYRLAHVCETRSLSLSFSAWSNLNLWTGHSTLVCLVYHDIVFNFWGFHADQQANGQPNFQDE